jgi:hypothetical protein
MCTAKLKLNKDIYEKEEVMALALFSSIAGESIFLLRLKKPQRILQKSRVWLSESVF